VYMCVNIYICIYNDNNILYMSIYRTLFMRHIDLYIYVYVIPLLYV